MSGPIPAEIFDMSISPIVYMADKERGNHSQPFHGFYLVSPQKLSMDHYRPDIFCFGAAFQNGFKGFYILPGRRISIAVSQKLLAFRKSLLHVFPYCLIFQHRITAVFPFPLIWLPHPCCAGLRGAV